MPSRVFIIKYVAISPPIHLNGVESGWVSALVDGYHQRGPPLHQLVVVLILECCTHSNVGNDGGKGSPSTCNQCICTFTPCSLRSNKTHEEPTSKSSRRVKPLHWKRVLSYGTSRAPPYPVRLIPEPHSGSSSTDRNWCHKVPSNGCTMTRICGHCPWRAFLLGLSYIRVAPPTSAQNHMPRVLGYWCSDFAPPFST